MVHLPDELAGSERTLLGDVSPGAGTDEETDGETILVSTAQSGAWHIVVPDGILQRIVSNASRALQVDRCSLALFDSSAGELVTVAAVPVPLKELRRTRFRPGEGVAGEVIRTGRPVIIDDATHDARFKRLGDEIIRSVICAPVRDGDSVLGTMTATSSGTAAFTTGQLELLSVFADQAGMALAQARRATEIEYLKSNFLSMVSHELRTPLNAINGFVDILLSGRTGPLTPVQLDFLQSVSESVRQLHRLVEDVMQVALEDSGHISLRKVPTDAADLIARVLRRLQPQADACSVHMVSDIAPDIPSVLCDPARIEQVLGNILSNAIKFSTPGQDVTICASDSDGGVLVSVTDRGPGIADSEQEKIFEAYYQAGHTRRTGIGLGLTIAKRLVEGHGGRIEVQSHPGQGATFRVWLPRMGPWPPAIDVITEYSS